MDGRQSPASHVACLLATHESSSDMAVVRGPFPRGLTREQADFLVTACSLLTGLVSSVVDADQAGRQQKQFGAVSEVASALSQAEHLDDVLPALATSVARISGFQWVWLCLVDEGLDNVLVAEDNAVNQRVAVRMLEKAGHRVDLVENGREAVEAVGRKPYDLVFMDCLMPQMNGFEATRAIRAAEVGTDRHLPIVALTANAMQRDREQCLAAGMDDHLTKPFTKQALTAAVERWTELPR